jgi:4-hydroxy-2-oxoheptanedioate aldolase
VTGTSVPSLRRRLSAGENLVGALVRMPAEEIVEMLAVAGHDFVLVDCEHGSADLGALRSHVTAAASFGLPVLVRTAADDTASVLRALDLGIEGIVAPHVDSAEDAARVVRATRYPPQGRRSYATYSRAGRYGAATGEEHRRRAEDVLVIAMIESPAAVDAVAESTAVPGIDGYLVGPSDLAAARAASDPPLDDLVALAHAGAAPHSLRLDIVGSEDAARRALAEGSRLVVHNVTLELMELFRRLRV